MHCYTYEVDATHGRCTFNSLFEMRDREDSAGDHAEQAAALSILYLRCGEEALGRQILSVSFNSLFEMPCR